MMKKKVVIIDYGSGNLRSVHNAVASLGACDEILITSNLSDVRDASHVILPGVGAFANCMNGIKSENGLFEELSIRAFELKKPILGICAGMQILADVGYEKGVNEGLGFIPGQVRAIREAAGFDESKYKIPQIGWNGLNIKKDHFIFEGVKEGEDVYFANSYRFIVDDRQELLASVEYGGQEVAAIVEKENILGIQFHPEKSGEVGLKILRNFINK